jgi:hypothetical protein
MIIDNDEVRDLRRHLDLCLSYEGEDDSFENPNSPLYLAQNPHLLMPLGFPEFRAINETDVELIPRRSYEVQGLDFEFGAEIDWAFPVECFFRTTEGRWQWFEGIDRYKHSVQTIEDLHLHFIAADGTSHLVPVREWLLSLERTVDTPLASAQLMLLPGLWHSGANMAQRSVLQHTMPLIIETLWRNRTPFGEIDWKLLEDIVAELLSDKGLRVHITPRSGDGGRDIIATGELFPGQVCTLAVEVKKKSVVGIADLRAASYANRDWPVLMLATSGRFSAGVWKEQSRNDRALRLSLKDGWALRKWLDDYAAIRGWRSNPR